MHIFSSRLLLVIIISFLLFLINTYIFYPILNSTNLIFPYAVHEFNIVQQYPFVWKIVKLSYYISSYISILLIVNTIFPIKNKRTVKSLSNKKDLYQPLENELNLLIGHNSVTKQEIYIPEKSLYQNILITGTIGSRKNKFCNVSIS